MTVVGVLGALAVCSGLVFLWWARDPESQVQQYADLLSGASLLILGAWAITMALL